MNLSTLRRIIKEEELSGANIYPSEYPHPKEVVMTTDGNKWTVGVTDERASIVETSVKAFGSEEEACEECIRKLRLLNHASKSEFVPQKRFATEKLRDSWWSNRM